MRALISVTDKTNIDTLAQGFEKMGIEVVSTGGTLRVLQDSGVDAIDIEEITNFPEILDGRVKTLSPMVHGGILFKRENKEHIETVKEHNIKPIDIVVVNLYDFEGALKTADEDSIIENIDIGGPTLIRSSAKNYRDVIIVTDPQDYDEILKKLENDEIDLQYRRYLATKAFKRTAYYDSMISRYFSSEHDSEFNNYIIGLKKVEDLRYGENPSQKAALYKDDFQDSLLSDVEVLHGKAMSFNNYSDLNSALELAQELGENAVVAYKHMTPCGAGIAESVYESYKKAYEGDSISIFGGIVAVNGIVDKETAKMMNEIFLEIVAAKDFTDEAFEILASKKNIRLIKVDYNKPKTKQDIRYLNGMVLIQERDITEDGYNVVTVKEPNSKEVKDLKFAMKVCKYAKSNAITVVKDGKTLGVGAGQTSRIWALESIKNNHPDVDFSGAVLASDAFFPFDDCVTFAAEMGITAIIQPGGSIKDKDSIEKCNEKNIAMVFTGNRHFRH